jgi:hypothetical protein
MRVRHSKDENLVTNEVDDAERELAAERRPNA